MAEHQTPAELKYTSDHEWVRVEGDLAVIGVTDFAQGQIGDVTFVELPEIGRQVAPHDGLCVVESVKVAADVYAPLAGQVAEANQALDDDPGAINRDPYGAGWLVKLKGVDPVALSALMDAAAYRASVQE